MTRNVDTQLVTTTVLSRLTRLGVVSWGATSISSRGTKPTSLHHHRNRWATPRRVLPCADHLLLFVWVLSPGVCELKKRDEKANHGEVSFHDRRERERRSLSLVSGSGDRWLFTTRARALVNHVSAAMWVELAVDYRDVSGFLRFVRCIGRVWLRRRVQGYVVDGCAGISLLGLWKCRMALGRWISQSLKIWFL